MRELSLSELKTSIKEKHIYTSAYASIILLVVHYFTYFFRAVNDSTGAPIALYFLIPIFNIVPYILLILYLKKYHNEPKSTNLFRIMFTVLALTKLLQIMELFGLFPPTYNVYYAYIHSFSLSVLDVIFIISYVLFIKKSSSELSKRIAFLICIVCDIICEWKLLDSSTNFGFIDNLTGYIIFLIDFCAKVFSKILLYVSLGLFYIKHKMPALSSSLPPKAQEPENASSKNDIPASPEQELAALKNKLILNTITEEEYNAQRAEIISKL